MSLFLRKWVQQESLFDWNIVFGKVFVGIFDKIEYCNVQGWLLSCIHYVFWQNRSLMIHTVAVIFAAGKKGSKGSVSCNSSTHITVHLKT